MKYITGAKNMVSDAMYRLLLDGQPKYTHESNYIVETLLEMYDVQKLPDGTLLLKFKTIDYYKWDDTSIQENLKGSKYKNVLFLETGIILDWLQTKLYTRVLVNVTKLMNKAPILRCIFIHQYLIFLKLALYTHNAFKNVVG